MAVSYRLRNLTRAMISRIVALSDWLAADARGATRVIRFRSKSPWLF